MVADIQPHLARFGVALLPRLVLLYSCARSIRRRLAFSPRFVLLVDPTDSRTKNEARYALGLAMKTSHVTHSSVIHQTSQIVNIAALVMTHYQAMMSCMI